MASSTYMWVDRGLDLDLGEVLWVPIQCRVHLHLRPCWTWCLCYRGIPLTIHALKGVADMSSSHGQIKTLLGQLTRWLGRVDTDSDASVRVQSTEAAAPAVSSWKWGPVAVLSVCRDLKFKSSDHRAVLDFIAALNTSVVQHSVADWRGDLSGRGGGMGGGSVGLSKHLYRALYGLRGLESVSPEVRGLLHPHTGALDRIVRYISSHDSIPIQLPFAHLSMAAMGLKSKNSRHSEVAQLLHHLTRIISATKPHTHSTAVDSNPVPNPVPDILGDLGRIMSGFSHMTSQERCVREYMSALLPLIDNQLKCNNSNSNGDYGNCMGVDTTSEPTDPNPITNRRFATIGVRLKGLSTEHRQTRQLLELLQEPLGQLRMSPGLTLTAKEVSGVLYGCQSLSSRHAETRAYVQMLSRQLAPSAAALASGSSGGGVVNAQDGS